MVDWRDRQPDRPALLPVLPAEGRHLLPRRGVRLLRSDPGAAVPRRQHQPRHAAQPRRAAPPSALLHALLCRLYAHWPAQPTARATRRARAAGGLTNPHAAPASPSPPPNRCRRRRRHHPSAPPLSPACRACHAVRTCPPVACPHVAQVSQTQPLLSEAERGEWAQVLSEFRSFVQAVSARVRAAPRPSASHCQCAGSPPAVPPTAPPLCPLLHRWSDPSP